MIVTNDPDCGRQIADLLHTKYRPDLHACIGRMKDGVLLGGCLYDHFQHESIHMHAASTTPHWLTRNLLWMVFDYPFNQLKVNRIFGLVKSTNYHAQKFNQSVGFHFVTMLPGVYPDNVACLFYCMERADCRHLEIKPSLIRSA